MERKEIILIGGIGDSKSFVGGEHSKNMHLLSALRECGRKVISADLADLKKHPWKGIRALLILMIHPKANVIISSSLKRSGWLIKILYFFKSRRNICFVGTGCEFASSIAQGRFKVKYFQNISNIIVQGASMKKELESVGLKAIVLPNFKRMDFLPKLPSKNATDIVSFVFLSRMNRKKGVNLIIECAKKLNKEGWCDRYKVDFYGSFEENAYKEEILKTIIDIPNVKYQGILNLREVSGYEKLGEYTVMLFPTFWPGEGFPGILIDALMAGVPVIASDWHFNPDIIEAGKTGFIIPNQDEESLYKAMKDVIETPARYTKMSAYCQQTAYKYDARNVINEDFLTKIKM